jgi:hypothetical protein
MDTAVKHGATREEVLEALGVAIAINARCRVGLFGARDGCLHRTQRRGAGEVNMHEQYLKVAVPMTAARDATPPAPTLTAPADLEAQLDEALQLTFPASDPIAVSARR